MFFLLFRVGFHRISQTQEMILQHTCKKFPEMEIYVSKGLTVRDEILLFHSILFRGDNMKQYFTCSVMASVRDKNVMEMRRLNAQLHDVAID